MGGSSRSNDRSRALRRLADHPALPVVIAALPPRALARLVASTGPDGAGAFMAHAPVGLLMDALAAAAWKSGPAGPQFDVDVFVDWLEIWLGEGEAFAGERLAALDDEFLALGFGELLRVEDADVTAFSREPDDPGELLHPGDGVLLLHRFLVSARRDDEWDIAAGALLALDERDPDRVLALLARLTLDDSRLDGETRADMLHADAVAAREVREEREGFVPAAAARAFLGLARALPLAELVNTGRYDAETARHLSRIDRTPPAPAGVPVVDAGQETFAPGTGPAPAGAGDPWALLAQAGVIDQPTPAGLLPAPGGGTLLALHQRLAALAESAPDDFAAAAAELAYLANVVLAARGASGHRTGLDEARELAFATCNAGLELLARRDVEVTPGVEPGLVRPFLVAFRVLEELPAQVVRAFERAYAAPRTRRGLAVRQWLDRLADESLDDLRAAVREQRFHAAREALGLLSLAFDTQICRAAGHLLDEWPAFPGILEGGDHLARRWIRSGADLDRLAAALDNVAPKHSD
jgi:hypothetical protein